MTTFIVEHRIRRLVLNSSFGWKYEEHGLSFLEELPDLEALTIYDHRVKDLSGIRHLKKLRELSLLTGPGSKLDFSGFTQLIRCAIQHWERGLQSVLERDSLEDAYFYSIPIHTLEPLQHLTRLSSLRIKTSPIRSLDGIEQLPSLRVLELAGLTKLEDISALAKLTRLEILRIDTSRKIDKLDDLRGLASLRILSVNNCGDIPSLAPIRAMTNLEQVLFVESTDIIDGDMSVLLTLPKLCSVSYRHRRHYSSTREEIRTAIERREKISGDASNSDLERRTDA